jgi:hypothetical protein
MHRYINNVGYDGKLWLLLHEDGNERGAYEGETVRCFRGEDAVLTGGRPPHKPGSTGKVWTEAGGEYYPSVFGLRWVRA